MWTDKQATEDEHKKAKYAKMPAKLLILGVIYGNSNDVDIRKITLFSTSITFHSVPECNDRFN